MKAGFILIFVLLIQSTLLGQDVGDRSPWKHPDSPEQVLDFSSLMAGEVDATGKSLRLDRPRFKKEKRWRWEPFQFTQQYGSKRMELSANGTFVEKYRQVPFEGMKQTMYFATVPDGFVRFVVPIESAHAWDLSAKVIATDELVKSLKVSKVVFVEEKPDPTIPPRPVDNYFGSVMKMETIRIQLPPGTFGKYLEQPHRPDK